MVFTIGRIDAPTVSHCFTIPHIIQVLSYLHSRLSQVDLHCQLFPHEDIRIPRLLEGLLQLLQLLGGEVGSVSPLLAPASVVVCLPAVDPGWQSGMMVKDARLG